MSSKMKTVRRRLLWGLGAVLALGLALQMVGVPRKQPGGSEPRWGRRRTASGVCPVHRENLRLVPVEITPGYFLHRITAETPASRMERDAWNSLFPHTSVVVEGGCERPLRAEYTEQWVCCGCVEAERLFRSEVRSGGLSY